MATQFYEFHQNNSGGSFVIDDATGIGPLVWIEANSVSDANNRANAIGIYFNGVDDERDCECCGDRWYPASDYDAKPMFEINTQYDFSWWGTVYIHFINGQIERINKDTMGQKAVS